MNRNLILFSVLVLVLLAGSASAQSVVSIEYGNGWQKICYSGGKCAYSNHETYLRWDNQWIPVEWLNISNGNWSYTVQDLPTKINFTADGKTITIPKANTFFNLQFFKISPSLTYSKTKLVANMVNVPTQVTFDGVTYPANSLAYLTFPYSLSQVKDFADENGIRLGRWQFHAGKEHIDIHDDVKVNHTFVNETGQNETYLAISTLDKSFYAFKIVNDEIRIYFVKSEANKLSGNITFQLNSWTVGEGGITWFGNSNFSNFMLDRNTNHIILPDAVTDGLVLYHKMSGSSGITSYDMNLTTNNNGILTNMSIGLNNGSSGWNSTGCEFPNCVSFDGIDGNIAVSNNASLSPTAITINAWINASSFPNSNNAVVQKSGGGGVYLLFVDNNGKLVLYLQADGVVSYIGTGSHTLSPNTLYYVTLTYDSVNGLKGYVNGELDNSVAANGNLASTSNALYFGKDGGTPNRLFNGKIDDIQIYNRALSNNEINQTMNNTMFTAGNLTTLYNAGVGNETYQIDVNATTPTNTNYTVWYADNGTSSWSPLGGTLTDNNSLTISGTKYQNTDVQVRLAGNTTSTPELIAITFWTQTIPAPVITSWGNDYTGGNATAFSIAKNAAVLFNATADQNITAWTWTGATQINGSGLTHSYASQSFPTSGVYSVTVNGTNAYGSTQTVTWTITVGLTNLTLTGCVNNSFGAYLKDALVTFNGGHVLTDSTGYYNFSGINDGDYPILVQAIGYTNHSETLSIAGNTTANFTMAENIPVDYTDQLLGLGFVGFATVIALRRRKEKRNRINIYTNKEEDNTW